MAEPFRFAAHALSVLPSPLPGTPAERASAVYAALLAHWDAMEADVERRAINRANREAGAARAAARRAAKADLATEATDLAEAA